MTNKSPESVYLGCHNCDYPTAISSCKDGFELCSSIDFFSSKRKIIKSMGWVKLLN
jgi:hypothetical protein